MSTNKACKSNAVERGYRSETLTLTLDEHARLRVLASKFGLGTELAAVKLLMAAVEALENEDEFTWPLFLVPTSMAEQNAQTEARRQARAEHSRALMEMN